MRVVFDDEALADLRHIVEWIAKDNPRAADALVSRISTKPNGCQRPNCPKWGDQDW